MMEDRHIERAGRAIKVMKMANEPGMDLVAIKLNCGLTYDEKKIAERWAKAFRVAEENPDLNVIDLALKIKE